MRYLGGGTAQVRHRSRVLTRIGVFTVPESFTHSGASPLYGLYFQRLRTTGAFLR